MAHTVRRIELSTGRRVKVIRCNCGQEVECWEFTNTCRCGADYNHAGQHLAPRECWGEETGEHPSECVGPFDGDDVGKGDY